MKLKNFTLLNIFILIIYWSITYVWNLVPFDIIDLSFLIIIGYFAFTLVMYPIKIKKTLSMEIICLIAFIVFAIAHFVNAVFTIKQSVFESFLTVREILYISVAFVFAFRFKYKKNNIRFIVKLEVIGCLLYFVTFALGNPISPVANFGASSVLVGAVNIYRDFCPVPLLILFVCPYIALGIANKNYLWNKRKDLSTLLLLIATLGIHLFRTRLMLVLLELIIIGFISIDEKKRRNLIKSLLKAGGILLIVLLIAMCIPTIRNRFVEGFSDILYVVSGGELNPYEGTFTYRMWLFNYRIQYLQEHHKLLFVLGAITSRSTLTLFGNAQIPNELRIIYNPDNAYMTMLPRYGIVGVVFYVALLGILSFRCYKEKTQLSVATALYIVCAIFEGMSSNSALCEYALLIIGMLVGMCMSEKNNKEKNKIR